MGLGAVMMVKVTASMSILSYALHNDVLVYNGGSIKLYIA